MGYHSNSFTDLFVDDTNRKYSYAMEFNKMTNLNSWAEMHHELKRKDQKRDGYSDRADLTF